MVDMCTAATARIALFIFNFVFWVMGAGVLAIGIWMRVDETIVSYLHVVNIHQSDPLIDHAGTIFIVIGVLVFVVGFLGCFGAIRNSQGILFMYAALILVIMVGEFIAGVLALVYRGKVQSNLQSSMRQQIREDYNNDTATGFAWNFLQVKLSCCGSDNLTDYENSLWWNKTRDKSQVVPVTCCVLREKDARHPVALDEVKCQRDAKVQAPSEYYHSKGCHPALNQWFDSHSLALMCIGFVAGAIQIVGFVIALCLRIALKKEAISRSR